MDMDDDTSNLTASAVITSQDELVMQFGVWSQQPDGIPEVVGHMLLNSLIKLYTRVQTGTEKLHPYLGTIIERLGSTFTEAVSNNTTIDWTKIGTVTSNRRQSFETNPPNSLPTTIPTPDKSSAHQKSEWFRRVGRKCSQCFQQNSECLSLMYVGGRGSCDRCSHEGLKCSYLEEMGRRPERKDQQVANSPSAVQTTNQPEAASHTSYTDRSPPPVPAFGSNTVVNKKCLQCRPRCSHGSLCISTNGRKSCDLCIARGYMCSLEFPPRTGNAAGAGQVHRQDGDESSEVQSLSDVVSSKRKPPIQPGNTSKKRRIAQGIKFKAALAPILSSSHLQAIPPQHPQESSITDAAISHSLPSSASNSLLSTPVKPVVAVQQTQLNAEDIEQRHLAQSPTNLRDSKNSRPWSSMSQTMSMFEPSDDSSTPSSRNRHPNETPISPIIINRPMTSQMPITPRSTPATESSPTAPSSIPPKDTTESPTKLTALLPSRARVDILKKEWEIERLKEVVEDLRREIRVEKEYTEVKTKKLLKAGKPSEAKTLEKDQEMTQMSLARDLANQERLLEIEKGSLQTLMTKDTVLEGRSA